MNVEYFKMNDKSIIASIKEAVSLDNVILSGHAKKRMRERRILKRHILTCLSKGIMEERPFVNDKNCWQITLKRTVAGMKIKVVAALDINTNVIVITAIKED